ncbi:MFS transporter [Alsobacter sp. SYSU M60028]|uniref:MFS transporter n=1 Tax=Alsobacter ponti TaxID=2962936 RepID=A0ABT1L8Q0_9HYPH|nr:MFS transporter [Alsobacter ponti]
MSGFQVNGVEETVREATAGGTGGSAVPGWVAPLAATILLQTTTAFLSRLVPTLAPILMVATGLPEQSIGYMSALSTAGSMLFLSMGTPVIRRYGPIRTLQVGMLLSGFGIALLASSSWGLLWIASVLLGLGYGPSAPAGSDILLRHAPARHRTLIFSIKQAGVPLGGVAAGLALPFLVERMDWRLAVLLLASVPIVTVAAVQPVRAAIDAARDPAARVSAGFLFSPGNMIAPLRIANASPTLRRLSAAGCGFAIGQGTWIAFLVTYLVHKVGMDLVSAGAIFAIMQATGIFGRVLLGWVSDRTGAGLATLAVSALSGAITTAAFVSSGPDWSFGAFALLAGIAGVTVSSWNGVHLAEVARLSPHGHVSEATAGATLVTFFGYVIGPAGFGAVVALSNSYALAFGLVAAICLASAVALVPELRRAPA